jgi:hypothetical protein
MEPEQQERFARAVERKSAEAEARSRGASPPEAPDVPGADGTIEQPSRVDTAHNQDDFSPRSKNTRHKKVTAENWNQ